MKTLIFIYRKASSCVSYQSRVFSSIHGIKSETPKSENLTWVVTDSWEVSDLQHLLQICVRKRSVAEGKSCHACAIQAGLQTDTLVSNILINMYSKCGLIDSARQVFDRMLQRSIISWNTMIGAHTQNGDVQGALTLFKQMQNEGTPSSEFTLSSILCACAAKLAIGESKQLHAFALKTAFGSNVFVGTAVLDVYAKCNLIKDACKVFDGMQEKTAVTWSSMVAGFVQNDLYEEALALFHHAQKMGLEQTQFTLSAALSACANLAAQIEGTQVHAVLVRKGFGSNLFVATSLVDMYAKCGSIKEAYFVFSGAEEKNVVLWNAMVAGFSKHACSTEAMILFEKMQQAGMCPNEVTYISLLSACSHVGLVKDGRHYFDQMIRDNNIEPNVHHYSCMVDLLGRSGLICEARELIERMPFEATASMWGSLLGSCRIYGNLESAEVAADRLFKIEPDNAGNHVLLSNAYAVNKKWGGVVKARKALKDSGVKKAMGMSWIEVKSQVHTFVVGERSHPRMAEIYAKLDDLEKEMKKMEYKAEIEYDLHDVGDNQKEELLRHHSEKLALAFGLISQPLDAPITIKKNLRICGDCHSVMKFASKITGRVIIVRDTNRFHHFRDGSCSCRDFW
ncbi:pentatricopeptide repeat-containing protein At5g04780, mitochondrial-like [Magnolia sinica]|uniref:pentatricopeptide repeat-containing protein At5g04780, mitochondrial-like n=1 Tax=Magnolia sinica TaxID=86752 RepID=UPI002658CB82|nr:pentatricopeptide repeat-containing protein At5g04780, mitochondrial-like [Magnolia sinica]